MDKKLLGYFFSLLATLCTLFSSINANEEIPEAWVAYSDENYFPLLEITIASVHAFSSRPIVAVGVNADIPFSTEKYPRLIKKRIDVDLSNRPIYVYKPQAILASNVNRGVYIDSDAILNKGCDALFDFCYAVEEHPLCPSHEKEAYVAPDSMIFFGVYSRSMHYVHADVLVFSKSCKNFIEDWNDICLSYYYRGIPCWDETLLNIYLWKIGATKQLLTIDPYNAYLDKYLSLNTSELSQPPYSYWYVFHGNKQGNDGWDILKRLQDHPHPAEFSMDIKNLLDHTIATKIILCTGPSRNQKQQLIDTTESDLKLIPYKKIFLATSDYKNISAAFGEKKPICELIPQRDSGLDYLNCIIATIKKVVNDPECLDDDVILFKSEQVYIKDMYLFRLALSKILEGHNMVIRYYAPDHFYMTDMFLLKVSAARKIFRTHEQVTEYNQTFGFCEEYFTKFIASLIPKVYKVDYSHFTRKDTELGGFHIPVSGEENWTGYWDKKNYFELFR